MPPHSGVSPEDVYLTPNLFEVRCVPPPRRSQLVPLPPLDLLDWPRSMLPPDELARIEACARSPFRAVRLFALERLASDGHPRLGELLLRLLQDADLAVRLEAVRVAGVSGCRATLPVLLELLNCADETIALQAAVSLGELGYYGELGSEALVPELSPSSGQARMSDVAFYALFVVLSAGLFLSGYLFHAQLQDEGPAAAATKPAI